jgi:UTP:GlnB (protein PII) uridylyltransferase
MKAPSFAPIALALLLSSTALAHAQETPAAPAPKPMKESQVEIYRITPGQQEEFLKFTALCDRANKEAGLAPRQLYVHQDGADWDFLIIQPSRNTEAQNKAWRAAATRLGIPEGGKFFLAIRKFIAVHTDDCRSLA